MKTLLQLPALVRLCRTRPHRRRARSWRATVAAVLVLLGGAAAAGASEQNDYAALLGRLTGAAGNETWSTTFIAINSSAAGLDAGWVQIRGGGTGSEGLLASLFSGAGGSSSYGDHPWRGFGEQGSWDGGPARDESFHDHSRHGRFHSVSPWTYARLLAHFWRLQHQPPDCQPIPEPGTAAVVLGALGAGLLVWRRRSPARVV